MKISTAVKKSKISSKPFSGKKLVFDINDRRAEHKLRREVEALGAVSHVFLFVVHFLFKIVRSYFGL